MELAAPAGDTARHEPHQLVAPRVQGPPSRRAIGHAYPFVDLERGVRRNGTLLAGALPQPLDTLRTMAQHAGRSESGLERIAKAERVGPKRPATMAGVSGEVRQPGRQLDGAPPAS